MSIRKIWSMPAALVTALLLVGMLGAIVLAQSNSAPSIDSLDDVEARLDSDVGGATDAVAVVDLAEKITDTTIVSVVTGPGVDTILGTADDVREDAPEQLAVTVMTTSTNRASIALATNYNTAAAPATNSVDHDDDSNTTAINVPSAVASWWDGLSQNDRASAVGLSSGTAASVCENTPNADFCTAVDGTGEIHDYAGLVAASNDPDVTVTQAFHWDMLSATEMLAVATAANLDDGVATNDADDYSAFQGAFMSLTVAQRTAVQTLYANNFLQRGSPSTLTATHSGTAADAMGDLDDDGNPIADGIDDRIGMAEVTVKVSDSYGRLIPPADGSDTVGDSFMVDVQGVKLEQLGLNAVAAGENDVRYIETLDDDGNVTLRTLRISGDAETVATIAVDADDNDDGTLQGLDTTIDRTRGALSNGAELGLSVSAFGDRDESDDTDTFTIRLEDFSKLQDGGQFSFRAYALTEEVNWEELYFVIELAVGNQPPEFTADSLDQTSFEVSEAAAVGDEIGTFTANDPDHTQDIEYSLSGGGGLFAIDDEDGTVTVADMLDYQGDEDDEVPGGNIYAMTVTASDGESTDDHDFTITVTDSPELPAVGSREFTIDENTTNTVAADGSSMYLTDSDGAIAMVALLDADGNHVPDDSEYEIDDGNSPAVAVALFGINPDGSLFLNDGMELNYESVSGNLYLLSVKANAGDPDGDGDDEVYAGVVQINVANVEESPEFAADAPTSLSVIENANIGDPVLDTMGTAETTDDVPAVVTATDDDAGPRPSYSLVVDATTAYTDGLFAIDSSTGAITVAGVLDAESAGRHDLMVKASDPVSPSYLTISIMVGDANEAPIYETPADVDANAQISENHTFDSGAVIEFTATDPDDDDLTFNIFDGEDQALFEIHGAGKMMDADGNVVRNADGNAIWSGELRVNRTANGTGMLDFDEGYPTGGYIVDIAVQDNDGLGDTLEVEVTLTNENDNAPEFDMAPATNLNVPENTARGVVIGNYSASDADGDTVTYSIAGADAKSFYMDPATGDLKTLESLDYDSNTPCSATGCVVMVVATDGTHNAMHNGAVPSVTITVSPVEDSVSTLGVTKANPVPGTSMGNAMTALGGLKESMGGIDESPTDLPNAEGTPMNFVDTEWANWGTVLRIEVTSQSPGVNCGNGNQCVVVHLNSDSADDTLELEAYRSADQENKFVTAVMLVELESDATNVKDGDGDDIPVYMHEDGTIASLQVDEEDEIEIEFGNLRSSIDVENEAPEIDNFSPAHEMAFDDADVDYTFTITDAQSGLPEPEDLPDTNGDADYTPVVALISRDQCETHSGTAPSFKVDDEVLQAAAHIHEDETLYCPGTKQSGEYNAANGGWGFAPIRDDKDFDEIDEGYDVETTIVLTENRSYYVTFIVCDNAGNCAFYDPDGNEDDEELAQITVDTEDPVFAEARTGLMWDATDNEYDDDRSFIQVIFNELTQINPATVEVDDFVVEGHVVKSVHVFETPDDDDVNWDDSGRYGTKGSKNKRNEDMYRDIENTVFIELEDELLADETPDVTLVPNGVEDGAGNEQDDGEQEADDWISPTFTIVSITSPRETSQSEVLAGEDEEVVVRVTADERLDQTRPDVTVTYVNAPSGSVDIDGVLLCDTADGADKGTRERGEIVNNENCQDNVAATGGTLNTSVEKVSNTEWVVTIVEPKPNATGYYNFHITGVDRSSQANRGSEGVDPDEIVTDFFDSDGDVNVDDAVFFEGDTNLANPNVRVSGEVVTDDEPEVEFRSPLFVEIDFTKNHMDEADCGSNKDSDHLMANCVNENSEYAEDNFDDVVITMFELDGVDMTDSVKTTDDQTFLVSLENVSVGDHTFKIQAMDQAGNMLDDVLEIDFEVEDRSPFELRLNPGWNLVSLPGEPADSSIVSVFGSGVEVRTVYTYDPVVPGGWMVAVRETLDSDWQGDLTEISGQRGYWVLSDAIQDWEVSIPRLAGGAAGTGTPIQPPSIPLYAGWNLIPVTDVTGNELDGGATISANAYLQGLNDGIEAARVLGFNTIKNEWSTIDAENTSSTLMIGSGYWVFVREATILVPGQ